MMKTALVSLFLFYACFANATSVQDFDVRPENPPRVNKVNLQKAIDWASTRGATLFFDPEDEPYHIDGGVILKENVSLIGVHGPTPRGTSHPDKNQPVGSVIKITDRSAPFITVESSTQIKGLQFWYPDQTINDPQAIISYPPTIQVSQEKASWDFIKIQGNEKLSVSIFGSRMRDYISDSPITVDNKKAIVRFVGCIDKDENFVNHIIN